MKEFEKLCTEYRENKRLIEELDAMNDSLKGDIIDLMGDRETVTEGSTKAIYKSVTGSRLDSKALKAERPDIAAAYTKETHFKALYSRLHALYKQIGTNTRGMFKVRVTCLKTLQN